MFFFFLSKIIIYKKKALLHENCDNNKHMNITLVIKTWNKKKKKNRGGKYNEKNKVKQHKNQAIMPTDDFFYSFS